MRTRGHVGVCLAGAGPGALAWARAAARASRLSHRARASRERSARLGALIPFPLGPLRRRSVKIYNGGHVNKEFCVFASFCLTHPVRHGCLSAVPLPYLFPHPSNTCVGYDCCDFPAHLQAAKLVVVGSEDKRIFLYDLNGKKGAAVRLSAPRYLDAAQQECDARETPVRGPDARSASCARCFSRSRCRS